ERVAADDDLVVGNELCVIDRGAIAKKGAKRPIRRPIGIDPRDAIEAVSVVIIEPSGKKNLVVRQKFDVTSPAIQPATHVKTRVTRAVGINANDAETLHVVVVREIAGHENFSIGLKGGSNYKGIRIDVDRDSQ